MSRQIEGYDDMARSIVYDLGGSDFRVGLVNTSSVRWMAWCSNIEVVVSGSFLISPTGLGPDPESAITALWDSLISAQAPNKVRVLTSVRRHYRWDFDHEMWREVS